MHKPLLDEGFGQLRVLLLGDTPAHDKAAEDVEEDIQVVVPLPERFELGDVPTPDLPGACGQQFWPGGGSMSLLTAPILDLIVLSQQTLHGGNPNTGKRLDPAGWCRPGARPGPESARNTRRPAPAVVALR